MKLTIIILTTLLMMPNLLYSATLHGISLPENDKVLDHALVLNGMGTRKAIFGIKVYVAGLYVEKKSQKADEILKTDSPKKLVMEFLRDVDKKKMISSWQEAFEKNCSDKCTTHATHLKKFLEKMRDMKEKDRLTMIFMPDRLDLKFGEGTSDSITNAEFSNIILSVFVGANPPNSELRDGLLGL